MDNHEQMSDGKTWALIGAVIFILVAIAVGISIAANIASGTIEHERSNADMMKTEARIAAVGKSNLASNPNPDLGKVLVVAEASAEPMSGKEVYDTTCFACHGSGVMGAPKYGDKAAWVALLDKEGIDELYDAAINGEGGMPARGGAPNLTDGEVKAAVDYIIENSK